MKISVVGKGRAGSALFATLRARAPEVDVEIWSRRDGGAPKIEDADFVFLAVSDDAIDEVCARFSGLPLVHLAGARGAQVGLAAFHPLASLQPGQEIPRGTTCGIDSVVDDERARLSALAVELDLVPARVEDRVAYHLGASLVANHSAALVDIGIELLCDAGLARDNARVGLARLLRSTADACEARALEDAITGPIPRGDRETIQKHLARIDDDELAHIYRVLGRRLAALAGRDPKTLGL